LILEQLSLTRHRIVYGCLISGVMPQSWAFLRQLTPPVSQAQQIQDLKIVFARLPVPTPQEAANYACIDCEAFGLRVRAVTVLAGLLQDGDVGIGVCPD
jgi:hypothetical protein